MSFSVVYQTISLFIMFALMYAISMGLGWVCYTLLNPRRKR